jgi:hypothetical protein
VAYCSVVKLAARGPRVPRPLVTRPAKLFVNLLLVSTSLFIFFTLKDLKTRDSFSSAPLRRSTTHATGFKSLL